MLSVVSSTVTARLMSAATVVGPIMVYDIPVVVGEKPGGLVAYVCKAAETMTTIRPVVISTPVTVGPAAQVFSGALTRGASLAALRPNASCDRGRAKPALL